MVRGSATLSALPSAVAVAAALACVAIVAYAAPLGEWRLPATMQQETTFVWAGSGQAVPAAGHATAQKGTDAGQQNSRPARIVAARGRMAARGQRLAATLKEAANPEPLGFDIAKALDTSYQRGEEGSSALIHIDLPIQQYQIGKTVGGGKPNMVPQNIDGTRE